MAGETEFSATLTVEECARYLGIARATAYEGVRSGQIPHIRVGRRVLIPRARLLQLLGEDGRAREAVGS